MFKKKKKKKKKKKFPFLALFIINLNSMIFLQSNIQYIIYNT